MTTETDHAAATLRLRIIQLRSPTVVTMQALETEEAHRLELAGGDYGVAIDRLRSEVFTSAIAKLAGRRLDEVERGLILATIAATDGNKTHAARRMGISLRSLREKVKAYEAQGHYVSKDGLGHFAVHGPVTA